MSEANLSTKAMLSTMIISRYRAKGRSKEVDKRVTEHFQTKRKAGSTQIDLLDPKAIKETQNTAYHISKHYHSMTLPWDEGRRILPSALYEQFKAGHEERVEAFNMAVDRFVIEYPALLRAAKDELGDELFNMMEFPRITEIRCKFGITLSFSPVPVAGDFRVTLSNEEMGRIQEEMNERNKALLAHSMHDAWARLYNVLFDMSERINKPQFRDSIVTNIQAITDILPELNLSNDADLERIRTEVVDKLCRYTPKELRNDHNKRGEVSSSVDEIMTGMRRLRTDL